MPDYFRLFLCLVLLVIAGLTLPCNSQENQSDIQKFIRLDGSHITCAELLSSYLQIPSVSGHEKEAGEFLRSVCQQNGLVITDLGNEEGNYNFAASLYPLENKRPNIILLNHIDVVPAGEVSKWDYPPYDGRIVNGEIWGRGALDMKGIAVAQLEGLLRFKSELNGSDFENNVTFLAVSAEEVISESGASYVVGKYLDLLNPVAVFCEGPTGMNNIVAADKEQIVFGISVSDKKPLRINIRLTNNTFAHGASAPENYAGKDLTLALGRLLSSKSKMIYNSTNITMLRELGKMEKGITGFVMRHPVIFKPLISVKVLNDPRLKIFFSNTITLIDYITVSHSANSIPQSIECRLDCRLMPEQDIFDFIGSVREKINNEEVELVLVDSLPGAKPSPTNNDFYRQYSDAIIKSNPSAKVVPAIIPGYSDCIQFRQKGIPAYGSNPFLLSMELLETIHNINERIPVSSLYSGAGVYYSFLVNVWKNHDWSN